MEKIQKLAALIETVHRLRAPGGCPWDRAQTHQSLRQYLIEEAYEVLDCLDRIERPEDLKIDGIRNPFKEELGDLFMQVLLHSEMASETADFDIYDVAGGLNEKLIRRHPHVFGENKETHADEALKSWEKQKAKEKGEGQSILSGVPKGLPSLQRASRILEKVTKIGFQWKDLAGPLDKVDEELKELKEEIHELGASPPAHANKRVENELGDLLFTLCNLAYLLKLNPEDALRGTLSRFESRFQYVEKCLREKGKTPEDSTLEEMDEYWNQAKAMEGA